jgi:hypothetical protein
LASTRLASTFAPSVTTSSRIGNGVGHVAEVMGSTPSDVDLVQLVDPGHDAVQTVLGQRLQVFFSGSAMRASRATLRTVAASMAMRPSLNLKGRTSRD